MALKQSEVALLGPGESKQTALMLGDTSPVTSLVTDRYF
jgi:hypothetical protein